MSQQVAAYGYLVIGAIGTVVWLFGFRIRRGVRSRLARLAWVLLVTLTVAAVWVAATLSIFGGVGLLVFAAVIFALVLGASRLLSGGDPAAQAGLSELKPK